MSADASSVPPLCIRADSTAFIGTGHLMRSLAVAEAWRALGGRVTFLTHCESPQLLSRILPAADGVRTISRPHPADEDLALVMTELHRIRLEQGSVPWLVLDGYHFDSAYQRAVRSAGYRVAVVDDMAHLPVYHADVLVNQNHRSEFLPYNTEPDTLWLMGSRYVLLRSEFLRWKDWNRLIPRVARRVLVTLGGSDRKQVLPRLVEALRRARSVDLEVVVLSGVYDEPLDSAHRGAGNSDVRLRYLGHVGDMAELMAHADIALSASGSTAWELAFMGLPGLFLVTADNQWVVARGIEHAGTGTVLGTVDNVDATRIADAVAGLAADERRRRDQSAAGRRLVDGHGGLRLAKVLLMLSGAEASSVEIRQAAPGDAVQLWRLANHPSVRQNAFHQGPIPLEQHLRWYDDKLSSGASAIWVMETQGVIVGQVRYDRSDSATAEVDIAVWPAFRGKGLGTRLLVSTWNRAMAALGVRSIRAVVLARNAPSARLFRKAGFSYLGVSRIQGRECHVFEKVG